MKMKPIVIAIAGLFTVFQWSSLRYEKADAKLSEFYSEVASARFGDARQSIDEAIRLWPSNARYYAWRGYTGCQQLPSQCPRRTGAKKSSLNASDQQAARAAIADYRHALQLNGRDAVAHHNLAWLEHLLGDEAAAVEDWRESVEIDPGAAVFHLSEGMFLEETGNSQAGRDQYELAIELSPSILDSSFFTRYRAEFPDAAETIVRHCVARIESRLQNGADPIFEARLGKLYEYSGNLKRATALLQDAAAKLPNLPLVWLNLGEIRESEGDIAEAMKCFKKANVIDSSLAGPYLKMGELYSQAGQEGLAFQSFRMAAQRWEHVKPITAIHNNRLYVGPPQLIDDLLPTTLVWFTTPCEASEAYRNLAALAPSIQRSQYLRLANTCEEIPSPHGFLRGN